jgi:hypothetical protein
MDLSQRNNTLKKMASAVAAATLALAALPAQADFQLVVDGEMGSSSKKYDKQKSTDTDLLALSGKFYFDKVSTQNSPVRVAGFLSQESSVSAKYQNSDADNSKARHNSLISLDYHVKDTPWRVGVGMGKVAQDLGNNLDIDATIFALGGGYYINAHSLLSAEIYTEQDDLYDQSNIILMYETVVPSEQRTLHIVGTMDSSAIDYDAGGPVDQSSILLSGKATLFLNPQLGVGGRVTLGGTSYDSDDYESIVTLGVHASYDFNEMIGASIYLDAGAGTYEPDAGTDTDFTTNTWGIEVEGRF